MLGDFNIPKAIEESLSGGRIIEVGDVTAEKGPLDVEESVLRVDGSVESGSTVTGGRSLVIEGSVLGEPGNPCRITAGEDVVITGSVENGIITARDIRIGENATDSKISAHRDVEIGIDLLQTRLVAGVYDRPKERLDDLRRKIMALDCQLGYADRQVAIEQKRMSKLIRTTGVALDAVVGGMVKEEGRQVVVDLDLFNEAMKGRSEEETDTALAEFYAKAVVGKLVKANRKYIAQNLTRRKVFMGVIDDLYKLFRLVRQRDRNTLEVYGMRGTIEDGLRWFNEQESRVWLGGTLHPGASITLIKALADLPGDEEVSLDVVRASIGLDDTPGATESGEEAADVNESPAPEAGLAHRVMLRLQDGRIVSEPIAETAEGVAA